MDLQPKTSWHQLHDDALLEQLRCKLEQERHATAEVLRLMAEVDRRRLYAQAACDSMFSYATSVLGLSEAAAYKRIQVARAGRRYPTILERVADGRLHLSGLCLLVPHLTADNHLELLDAAAGLGKRQIEQLLAARFPRPEVRSSLHRQPMRSQPARDTQRTPMPTTMQQGALPSAMLAPGHETLAAGNSVLPVVHHQRHPQPLSSERYLLKVTISTAARNKLRQCQELLAGQVADGDIAQVLERALDALLTKQLGRKYAVGAKARSTAVDGVAQSHTEARLSSKGCSSKQDVAVEQPLRSRAIPAAVRRAVYQRDGAQCSYVDPQTGRRCQARRRLEFHHRLPFARGGAHSVDNVCLLCRAHNDYEARRDFGAAHVAAAVAARRHSAAAGQLRLPRGEVLGVPGSGGSG